MLSKFVSWFLELFRSKSKDQNELEELIKNHKKKLKEIEDENTNIDDTIDRLNK